MEIFQSETFRTWLDELKDRNARARILARIDRMASGNPGDAKSIGGGLSEARIDCGPGYRLYFMLRGGRLIVLLAGGTKKTQSRDIARAKDIAKDWKE